MGAALGCLAVVAALFVVDPVCVIFVLAALSSFAAWWMLRPLESRLRGGAKLAMAVFLLAGIAQGTLYHLDQWHLGVIWAKSLRQDNTIFEKWNAISRVRVVPYPSRDPFGWGFGRQPNGSVEQLFLDIDAGAGTVITNPAGHPETLNFLADDVINTGYFLRPVKDVAVIGVGGGRDILSARYFGADHIAGIELNPTIIAALSGPFADFSGRLGDLPGVTMINAEARSWLSRQQQSFDLVQISLIDTWAATAAGGLTLSENRLYTVDAWTEFLQRLRPNGMLAVSRWFDRDTHTGEFYRLLSIASEALMRAGVAREDVGRHILALGGGQVVTVVTSMSPISEGEMQHMRQVAQDHGFTLLFAPGQALDETSGTIGTGKADSAFYAGLPIDVSAPTDDRPFFFFMTRWQSLLPGHRAASSDLDTENDTAIRTIAFLLVSTFVFVIGLIVGALPTLRKRAPLGATLPHLAYFGGIGLAFMLIEIAQMQRLLVFLGHPIFGLSVVLFTLLLFGGIGSATLGRWSAREPAWGRPALLCLVLSVTGLATQAAIERLTAEPTAIRILASIALLAPGACFMGMMFPIGMRLSAPYAALQPWFWGLNGATSVFASVLAMAISMQVGISAAFWTGVVCYVLATLLVV